MKANRKDASYYIQGIREGSKYVLSKAITLAESTRPEDEELFARILSETTACQGNAIRIGITGVPGVGKSTFIEALGDFLIQKGHRVAVLAIDPSSTRSGGSILGDKTRMQSLSRNSQAFIRPSPTRATLGGVAANTRENILLCEAAGYDIVIVETVGVGQSETLVRGMVDFFLLLLLPGGGDELQGIKKGIVEMADCLIVHKCDGDNVAMAKKAKLDYEHALALFPAGESTWKPPVVLASSLTQEGIDRIHNIMEDYMKLIEANGYLSRLRSNQNLVWFREQLSAKVLQYFFQKESNRALKEKLENSIKKGEMAPRVALSTLFASMK